MKTRPDSAGAVWDSAAIAASWCALLPLAGADPRAVLDQDLPVSLVRVAFSLGPFCCVLGFLTPLLVDRWSQGSPDRAARAYAVNALGCIIGPLVAAFLLLPAMGEGVALVVLAAPLVVFPLLPGRSGAERGPLWPRILGPGVTAATAVALIVFTRDFGSLYPEGQKRRDHTATVIATGQGMRKQLLVNGVGVTSLTPITKMMVHLPAALLPSPPRNILILCFGMGTSYRSALSWGGAVTVVDLVPSVPPLMGYFHSDGDRLLGAARGSIVIDDARRYLERTSAKFDLIVIDPPPPVEAAASSLLYSREFYAAAAQHLQPGGILQQWLPEQRDVAVASAMAQALARGFPEHRVFRSVENWGRHFVVSAAPIPRRRPISSSGARTPLRKFNSGPCWSASCRSANSYEPTPGLRCSPMTVP